MSVSNNLYLGINIIIYYKNNLDANPSQSHTHTLSLSLSI